MKEILKNLPTYEPPKTVWEAIKTRLPLLEMRTYEPPTDIWESIENQLVTQEKPAKRLPILRGVWKHYKLMAAASVTLLIAFGLTFFLSKNKTNDATIVVTTEVIDNQLIQQNWSDSDKDFALVEAFCETALPKCEEPEFKNLKTELDDLNKAREHLKNVLSAYNSDPEIVAQLTKLENVRSDILKKIMAQM
jgi:hypothetical protein